MDQLELPLADPRLPIFTDLLDDGVTVAELNRKLREAFFEDLKNGEPCPQLTTL